ncbi:MAG: DUF4349 domain-containing protein [Clostridia bacterium]|nr:DUF4349 domain-containing protein [Clostridia bacterium]
MKKEKQISRIKRTAFFLAVLFTLVALGGCGAGKKASVATFEEAAYDMDFEESAMMAADNGGKSYGMRNRNAVTALAGSGNTEESAPAPAEEAGAYARKIVYNATQTIRADEPRRVLETATERCKELGGYLSASYERSYSDGTIQITATLKVPADHLNDVLDAIGTLGKVESSRISSDDITRSYYDVQARLTAAEAEEKQLLALYEKCEKVEEMLLVREQLAAVRSDIESYRGSINLWDHQVSFATIDLTVKETQKTPAATEDDTVELWKASDVFRKMRNGFANSWRVLVNAIAAIGIFLANAFLPLAVLGVIVYGVVRLLVALCRKRKARREAKRAKKTAEKEERKNE